MSTWWYVSKADECTVSRSRNKIVEPQIVPKNEWTNSILNSSFLGESAAQLISNKMLLLPLILFLTYFTYKTLINTAQKSKNYENEDNLAKEKMWIK